MVETYCVHRIEKCQIVSERLVVSMPSYDIENIMIGGIFESLPRVLTEHLKFSLLIDVVGSRDLEVSWVGKTI